MSTSPATTPSSPPAGPTSPSSSSAETPSSPASPSSSPPTQPTSSPPTSPATTPPTSGSPASTSPPSSAVTSPSSAASSIPPSSTPTPSLSSTPTVSQASATPSKTLSLSDTVIASTSGTSVVFVTVHVSPTASSTAGIGSQSNDTTSKGFFQNKGAVAGVFTVVGLVGVVLLIALVTNAIRRRQAQKFDRDVAEAAAEAVANARSPNFDDDDLGYRDPHYTGYSDGSHGTYGQAPIQPVEQYGMNEMSHYDPYAAAVSVSGAAGIGAAGVTRQKSTTTPFNAFAAPAPDVYNAPNPYISAAQGMPQDLPNHAPDQSLRYRTRGGSGGNQLDLLQAAGLGGVPGSAAAAAARGTPGVVASVSTPSTTLRDTPSPAQLSRNKSLGTGTLGSNSSHGGNESYAAHYRPDFNPNVYQPPTQGAYVAAAAAPQVQARHAQPVESRPTSAVDPYDGIAYDSPGTPMANPYSPSALPGKGDPQPVSGNFSSPESSSAEVGKGGGEREGGDDYSPFHEDDSRMSLRDDEDYGFGGGRRVLKVANQ